MSQKGVILPETRRRLRHWYAEELLEKTPVLRGSFFGGAFGLFGQAAVTIDGTVHLTRHAPDDLDSVVGVALLGHELFHVVQQREIGWGRFLGKYVLSWRRWHVRDGRAHPLEAPAYARGEEIRRALEGMG